MPYIQNIEHRAKKKNGSISTRISQIVDIYDNHTIWT